MNMDQAQARPGTSSYLIFAIFPLLLIGYVLILSMGSIAGFPESMASGHLMPFLSDKPVGEDGFYMLSVAYNIARGNGITYNYQIPTTGIQPLATMVFAAMAKVNLMLGGNKWSFVRVVIGLAGVLHILLAYLIGMLSVDVARRTDGDNASKNNVFILGSGLALLSMGLFRLSTYGLETPFYLCSLALTLHSIYKNQTKINTGEVAPSLLIGVLTGISILARIDAAVIWTTFYLLLLAKNLINLNGLIVIGLVSLLVSLPWFAYVYSLTGSIMPSSGGAQSALIDLNSLGPRLNDFILAVVSHLSVVLAPGRSFLAFGSFGLVACVSLFIAKRKRARVALSGIAADSVFRYFTISVFILCIIYPVVFWASHFYFRYTSPLVLIAIPALSVVIASCFRQRWILLLLLASALLFAGQAYGSFHSKSIGNNHSVTAGFVASQFNGANYRVGAFQSGVIGYFNENTINLDGKLDPEALKYLRSESIQKYVNIKDINVIVDWESGVDRVHSMLKSDGETGWESCSQVINNKASTCIVKK